MRYRFLTVFFLFLVSSLDAASPKSTLSRSSGELVISGNVASTRDVALIMSNRRMRFNTTTPAAGIPTQAIGVFDIYTGAPTTEKRIFGFGEFRELSDPTNPQYNSVEASDPVGAHFFFAVSNNTLALQVRDSASWASPTNNLLIFGSNGSIMAASNVFAQPDANYKLWVKGDNTLRVSGGIDGPEGGQVRLNYYTLTEPGYMRFAVETSSDFMKKYLWWYLTTGNVTRSIKFLVQDSSLSPIPYNALGSSDTVKTFIIDHPTATDKYLVHASIEGPQNRVYYRGKVTLQHGQAFVPLPDYFEGLTQEEGRAVFLQNMSDFDKVSVKTQDGLRIKNGVLHIMSENKHGQSTVSWEVSALRKDVPDLIVAPRTEDVEVLGFGPYRYVVPKD
jgi:hypothetical protein